MCLGSLSLSGEGLLTVNFPGILLIRVIFVASFPVLVITASTLLSEGEAEGLFHDTGFILAVLVPCGQAKPVGAYNTLD